MMNMVSALSTTAPELSLVIPAYNEGEGVDRALATIAEILQTCSSEFEIIVVDDGSQDNTYARVCHFAETHDYVKGVSFSRNFGKEAAVLAGLRYATGKAVVVIDADLQHPPELIPQMLEKWRSGANIVHAVKRSRDTDSLPKRLSAWAVNQLISRMGGINIHNSSDYKLLDREIVDILVYQLPERERFFRGLSSWIGFSQEYIEFDVSSRIESESKWSLWSLIELAITALTSFTSMPLRIITLLGFITLVLGFGVASDALWSWYHGQAVSGFATIIITLLLLGSFIMISLGIIGEYIAKIYEEIKARPPYLVKATVGISETQQ
jgi:glycosyltransferase involved in cell wall biosynthesis